MIVGKEFTILLVLLTSSHGLRYSLYTSLYVFDFTYICNSASTGIWLIKSKPYESCRYLCITMSAEHGNDIIVTLEAESSDVLDSIRRML